MGIVNITPNSFSDGTLDAHAAIEHGLALVATGADLLDLGAEATNPRAAPVTAEEEWQRLASVLQGLRRQTNVPLSVDTWKASVAARALDEGATIINDISGGRFDAHMLPLVAAHNCTYIAGHLRGQSIAEVFANEREATVDEVVAELDVQLLPWRAQLAGRLWIDPGLGFGKGAGASNWALLRAGHALAAAFGGAPVVIGTSRKRFLRALVGGDVAALDLATVGTSLAAVQHGAQIVRVHNVAAVAMVLRTFAASAARQ